MGIARAYDALRKTESCDSASSASRSQAGFSDFRSGFCNQCAGNPDVRCSCSHSSSEFSMEAALALFKEIFGEDIRDALAKLGCAAGQAAGVAGQAVGGAATMAVRGLSVAGQAANVAGQAAGE